MEYQNVIQQHSDFCRKIKCAEKMLGILTEQVRLMSGIQLKDLSLRQKLSEELKLSSVTNNGYLMVQKYQ